MFHDIAERVGQVPERRQLGRTPSNNYGKIRDMESKYGSMHTGKYDADDTFALVAFDYTDRHEGDWSYSRRWRTCRAASGPSSRSGGPRKRSCPANRDP